MLHSHDDPNTIRQKSIRWLTHDQSNLVPLKNHGVLLSSSRLESVQLCREHRHVLHDPSKANAAVRKILRGKESRAGRQTCNTKTVMCIPRSHVHSMRLSASLFRDCHCMPV